MIIILLYTTEYIQKHILEDFTVYKKYLYSTSTSDNKENFILILLSISTV